jgi:5-methylcytosine-specific restriction protein B
VAKVDRDRHPGSEKIYAAAATLVNEGLRKDGSLFLPQRAIWTESVAVDLHERFVQHPDPTRKVDFETKFKKQLAGAPPLTIQLAGELLYVHFLITTQLHGDTKRKIIANVLSWSSSPVQIPPDLAAALDDGLVNAGQGFLMYRPFMLAFLVEFVIAWKKLPDQERAATLDDPWRFKAFALSVPAKSARLQLYGLLHLVHPATFEPVVSERHKQLIVEGLGTPQERQDTDLDRALFSIRQRLTPELGIDFSYYREPLRSQWMPNDDETDPPLEPPITDPDASPRYWVEKTLVAGRPDRQSGPTALGKAIWSPQRAEDGRDYYRTMREVRLNDLILHFVDNQHIVGISRVANGPDTTQLGDPNTPWGGRPSIRYSLEDYTALKTPIDRDDIFQDASMRPRVLEILENHRGLFFNRSLELNQGAYLTSAPRVLLNLLNDIYKRKTGEDLPLPTAAGAAPRPPVPQTSGRSLTLDWLSEETLWPQERLLEILQVLNSKSPHVILAGPPGTGKTWIAQLLARYLTQDRAGRSRLVQFHPSYSYEAFVEGLRPIATSQGVAFRPVPGVVLEIENQIKNDDAPFVLVIDEMNRANLPRVFGELMFLLEYRDHPIDLQYTSQFRLSANLRFVGTMNTADRSIRSIDAALRRRFDIFDCPPDPAVLERYFIAPRSCEVPSLIDGLRSLNEELRKNLDRHHTVGHTFFMVNPLTADELLRIWKRKIEPLIEDYFFDQPDVAKSFEPGRFWPELQD